MRNGLDAGTSGSGGAEDVASEMKFLAELQATGIADVGAFLDEITKGSGASWTGIYKPEEVEFLASLKVQGVDVMDFLEMLDYRRVSVREAIDRVEILEDIGRGVELLSADDEIVAPEVADDDDTMPLRDFYSVDRTGLRIRKPGIGRSTLGITYGNGLDVAGEQYAE